MPAVPPVMRAVGMGITIRCRRAPFLARGAPPRPGRSLLMTPSDDTTTATAAAAFDVREFARTARGSHRSELDLSELAKAPLPADAARLIRILRDLERATMQRMRNLLVT